jgi:hypothetical protein
LQFLGKVLNWRLLDPIGGMVLSTYIIVEWVKTLLENFRNRAFGSEESWRADQELMTPQYLGDLLRRTR